MRHDSWTEEGFSKYISYICSAYKEEVPFKNVSSGGGASSTLVEKNAAVKRFLFFAMLVDDANRRRCEAKRIFDIANFWTILNNLDTGVTIFSRNMINTELVQSSTLSSSMIYWPSSSWEKVMCPKCAISVDTSRHSAQLLKLENTFVALKLGSLERESSPLLLS